MTDHRAEKQAVEGGGGKALTVFLRRVETCEPGMLVVERGAVNSGGAIHFFQRQAP
ncbi:MULTISPECIES: hypothetical protein [Rhodomicrobium]|uniref:hypothetical protein n=1 Tax=Rhodomicrobium TaxID=1068 RepID=UPI001483A6B4